MERRRIAFIGLGSMGAPMFQRILDAGFEGVAWDVDRAACERFAGSARIAGSAAEAARSSDVLFACLPSIEAYESLVASTDSVRVDGGFKLYVHVGTTGPTVVQRLAGELDALGIETVDAPMTGGVARAREGRLTTMTSGPARAHEHAGPAIGAYSDHIEYLGPRLGNAQIMKLINNVLSVSNLALAGEALLVGMKAGLDASTMLAVLNKGTGQSDASSTKIPDQVLTGRFAHGGAMHITKKDLRAFLETAASLDVPTPLVATVAQAYRKAMEHGSEMDDVTAVIRHMEEAAGVELRQCPGAAAHRE